MVSFFVKLLQHSHQHEISFFAAWSIGAPFRSLLVVNTAEMFKSTVFSNGGYVFLTACFSLMLLLMIWSVMDFVTSIISAVTSLSLSSAITIACTLTTFLFCVAAAPKDAKRC